jgi:translation initiation factor 1
MTPPGRVKSFDELGKLFPGAVTTPAPGSDKGGPGGAGGPVKGAGPDGRGMTVSLGIEKKGRKGKTVTIVRGLHFDPATIERIAKFLKERCATGGTVREGIVELQGDQRPRVAEELRKLNFRVKG